MPGVKRIPDLDGILEIARALRRKRVLAVSAAADDAVIHGAALARERGIAMPVLFGDRKEIKKIADKSRVDIDGMEIIDVPDPVQSCREAVQLCRSGKADVLMKGLVGTADLLKAVLDRQNGLHTGRLLSHAAVFRSPRFDHLMILTDPGVNIKPDVARKLDILKNAVEVAESLGMNQPRVAILAAVEKIKPEMTATTDAAIIVQMAENGQLGDIQVGGPYALDLAVSEHAALIKRVKGKVAGRADILLAPDIEAGNILYKSLVYFAGLEMATVVMGATVPIVVCSRSDSAETKLFSIALSAVIAARSADKKPA